MLAKLTPVMFSFKSSKKFSLLLKGFKKGEFCVFDSLKFMDGLLKFLIFFCYCIVCSFFLYALTCYISSSLQIDVGVWLHFIKFLSASGPAEMLYKLAV